MANSIELLHFIHQEVPCLLHGISQMEEEEEEDCMGNYFTEASDNWKQHMIFFIIEQ